MKRLFAVLLALTMTLSCVSALAETTKHERVFIVADPEGNVKTLTDNIRLENGDMLEELIDRTMLTNIENVDGDETFTLDGETLTWKANGKDITYQGTSDKLPAILPAVKITLDGQEVTARQLKDMTGEAVLTVSYQMNQQVPAIAVSLLPLPQTGVSDLKLTNATMLNEMGMQVLVGWAVPGVDAKVGIALPETFTASFHADHVDLNWMMTVTTSDPIDSVFQRVDGKIDLDAHKVLDELTALLTAVKEGQTLPVLENEKANELVAKLNELNDGIAQLNDGAVQLADGSKQLADGASALSDGMSQAAEGTAALNAGLGQLTDNNELLNSGASQIFDAILATANEQLAASGLDQAGITLPALTQENYAEQLDGALEKLSPEAVDEMVNRKVLEIVLEKAKMNMTVEEYEAAVAEKKINVVQQGVIKGFEQAARASEEVQQKMALAQTAYDSLKGLKDQLDQLSQFVSGVKAYTDGVAQAATGSDQLNAGMAQLKDGAAQLSDGAAQLRDGANTLQSTGTQTLKDTLANAEKTVAEKLLPFVQNDLPEALRLYEDTRDNARNGGYDLRLEDVPAMTVYITRTDLQ